MTDLVACKSCGDWGWQEDGDDVAKCPCRWIDERPCDPLCRCSNPTSLLPSTDSEASNG